MTNIFSCRVPLAAATFFVLATCLTPANASTVTYDFTQGGFVDGAGDAGTLTGSFTGTPEANGTLQAQDLTSFAATFRETVAGIPDNFEFPNDLSAFSFDPNEPSSLEFAAGSAQSGFLLCSGGTETNQVCFGINPNSGEAVDAFGFFEDLPNFGPSTTTLGPVVNTVAGSTATAPEPASGSLFAGAGFILVLIGTIRKRRAAH